MPISDEMMDEFAAFDDAAAECGGFVDPNAVVPDYDIRAIEKYCSDRGVDSSSLTDEELLPFIRQTPQKQNAA